MKRGAVAALALTFVVVTLVVAPRVRARARDERGGVAVGQQAVVGDGKRAAVHAGGGGDRRSLEHGRPSREERFALRMAAPRLPRRRRALLHVHRAGRLHARIKPDFDPTTAEARAAFARAGALA